MLAVPKPQGALCSQGRLRGRPRSSRSVAGPARSIVSVMALPAAKTSLEPVSLGSVKPGQAARPATTNILLRQKQRQKHQNKRKRKAHTAQAHAAE